MAALDAADDGDTSIASPWQELVAGMACELTPALLLFLRRVNRLVLEDQLGGGRLSLSRSSAELAGQAGGGGARLVRVEAARSAGGSAAGAAGAAAGGSGGEVQVVQWLCVDHVLEQPPVARWVCGRCSSGCTVWHESLSVLLPAACTCLAWQLCQV